MTVMENDIHHCLDVLKKGGLILYPTDTIWGIGCDATNEEAVNRIYELKQRPPQKSMIVLMASEKEVLTYTASPDLGVFDYLETCTQPTTVIFDHAIGLADNLQAADGSIGVRLVKDVFCQHLIKRLRKPLVSTSANVSGKPAPAHFGEIAPAIINGVDYVVVHRQDDRKPASPSSVIRWMNGRVEKLR